MTGFLTCVVLVALLAAWVLLLFLKWGIIEWLQVHGSDLVSKAANCFFCMSWWMCVVLSIIAAVVLGEWSVLAVPFFATPITRRLL